MSQVGISGASDATPTLTKLLAYYPLNLQLTFELYSLLEMNITNTGSSNNTKNSPSWSKKHGQEGTMVEKQNKQTAKEQGI